MEIIHSMFIIPNTCFQILLKMFNMQICECFHQYKQLFTPIMNVTKHVGGPNYLIIAKTLFNACKFMIT